MRDRSIAELLGLRFFVPDYQRGYRWTRRQVWALLDDIQEFRSAATDPKAWYCLQPVVVRRMGDEWEVVDGQQRLTTIRLILVALGDLARSLEVSPYQIRYETRDASYLDDPVAERADECIDFHFIHNAHVAIQEWMEKLRGPARLLFLNSLVGGSGEAPNVRVIWYEIDDDDPRAAFERLNTGRIKLTSAELIRALFLRSGGTGDGSERDRALIAQDWDLLERELHEPSYWFFLQQSLTPPAARIEFLFDVFVALHGAEADAHDDDELRTFLAFKGWFDGEASREGGVWGTWRTFHRLAQTLRSWHADPVLGHLVGYLVATAASGGAGARRRAAIRTLVLLLRRSEPLGRSAFERLLRAMAFRRLLGRPLERAGEDDVVGPDRLSGALDELRYGDGGGNRRLVSALLLFNVAECSATHRRFRFDLYARERWDLEHVRSVTEYVPQRLEEQRAWLRDALDRFLLCSAAKGADSARAAELTEEARSLLEASTRDPRRFFDLFRAVRRLAGEDDGQDDHTLANLVLLDAHTNRGYRNAIFPVKRATLVQRERDGLFVLPGTRRAFLKYYTDDPGELLFWSSADREAYGAAIGARLAGFFAPLAPPAEPM